MLLRHKSERPILAAASSPQAGVPGERFDSLGWERGIIAQRATVSSLPSPLPALLVVIPQRSEGICCSLPKANIRVVGKPQEFPQTRTSPGSVKIP